MIQIKFPSGGNSVEQAGNDFARDLVSEFVATSGFPDLSVYVSYAYQHMSAAEIMLLSRVACTGGMFCHDVSWELCAVDSHSMNRDGLQTAWVIPRLSILLSIL
jgi:hypothetical protein